MKGSAKKGTSLLGGTPGWMAIAFGQFEREERAKAEKMKINEMSVCLLINNKWKKMTDDEKAKYLNPNNQVCTYFLLCKTNHVGVIFTIFQNSFPVGVSSIFPLWLQR